MSENINTLKSQRKSAKSFMTRIHTWMDKNSSTTDDEQFRVRIEHLEKAFAQYSCAQDEIEVYLDTLTGDDVLTDDEDRDTVEQKYFSLISKMKNRIKVILSPQENHQSTSISENRTANISNVEIKLPDIQVPTFNGEITNWSSFFELFDSLILSNPNIPNIRKFVYLKNSLIGEPKQLVDTLELNDSNLDIAIETLKKRYENKNYILNRFLSELFDFPILNKTCPLALRNLVAKTFRIIKSIENLKIPQEKLLEYLYVFIINRKIDISTKRIFEQQRKADQFPTLDDYFEFLQNRCTLLENIQDSPGSNNNINVSEQKRSKRFTKVSSHLNVDREYSQNSISCYYCKSKNHKIYFCDTFKEMSVADRYKFVDSIHLCKNCLGGIHNREHCQSIRGCQICNQKHHTLIHIENYKSFQNQNNPRQMLQNDNSNRRHLNNNTSHVYVNRSQNPPHSHYSCQPRNVVLPNSETCHRVNLNQTAENLNPSTSKQSQPVTNSEAVSALSTKETRILLTTAKVTLYSQLGHAVTARVLLDTGSQICFVTQDLVDKLQCVPIEKSFHVTGINQQTTVSNKMVNLTIFSNITSNDYFKVSCAILPRITGQLPRVRIQPEKLKIPPNIQLADPDFYNPSDIQILLGCNIYYSLISEGFIQLGKNQLFLQNTRLGWVVAGDIPPHSIVAHHILMSSNDTSLCTYATISNSDLNNNLEKFWSIEDISSTKNFSSEDELSEKIFSSTIKILENGRFQANMPLKSPYEHLKLGDTFSIAKRRFNGLERRFANNSALFLEYKKFIDEYVKLGHAKYVPLTLKNSFNENKYFIPHLCVIREQSISTRLRVVFDSSCPSTTGLSLNDVTLKGYQVQPDLFDILCRFRQNKFVITADIEKMFRQININPDQTFLQNILWRDKSDLPLQCIELTTVTYGCNFSPFIATRVLHEIANRGKSEFPLASYALNHQTYMDDILSGANSEKELDTLYYELNSLLSRHGFLLHKWSSNCPKILDKILQTDTAHTANCQRTLNLNLEFSPNKVLGLNWYPNSDEFNISIPNSYSFTPITKRKILSVISQCFDPLGIINPVILKGKLLMQHLWCSKIEWDKNVSDPTILSEWNAFISNLPDLAKLQIPRFIFSNKSIDKIEIHSFADASNDAYGTCLYFRTIYLDNSVSCVLISAKSRVAPISKRLTIPRLELSAMLLAAQLTDKIINIFSNTLKFDSINLWSDSKVALCWNNGSPSRWTVFVANRVSKINELSGKFKWRYVKSEDNPADIISRGCQAADLIKSKLWWNGPNFLLDSELRLENFNENFYPSDSLEEEISLASISTSKSEDFWIQLFSKFSSFSKLKNTVAYMLRFSNNCKNIEKRSGSLSPTEISIAEDMIIKILQNNHFKKEISELSQNKVILNKQINSLKPFLDESGLVRVGGRLQNANIPYSHKHPLLLPSKHYVVKLMLKLEHQRLGHAGAQTTLSNFRLRYWPLNGLKEIKKTIRECHKCFRFSTQPYTQIMANLPKDRVNIARPFQKVGIDYGGPFLLKSSRLRKAPVIKCYIAIFICLITKCVHIEAVTSLSTEAFLLTLKRFIARRGNPSIIFSDNATNFVGANNKLQDLHNFFKNQRNYHSIQNYLSQTNIEWKFIPPRSPHWGGIWESAIKCAKYHMVRIIGNASLTFEEFSTVLTQIEAILNSRPISALSNDPTDLECLTPGHFLIGNSLTAFPEKDLTSVPENRISFWHLCSRMQQHFWKRWSTEYLHRLQNRPKWLNPSENLKVNDLVLLKEETTYPQQWPLARVVEVLPGSDGKVRLVKVRTVDGIFIRSVTRICPFPKSEEFKNFSQKIPL